MKQESEKKIPPEAMGVKWPLTIYVCQQCARPTLFEEDKCCSGFQSSILVEPIDEVKDPYKSEMLPGPYRINPDDGNAYRLDSASSSAQDVWITDIFGGHHTRVSESEWLTWKEVEEG